MITLSGSQKLNKQELAALIGIIRAIVYARVSTDGQVEKYSLESQIELCVNLAKSKGISEDEIIVLIEDGESGDNPNRPMINYLIFLLQYGIGDHAIFLHPDRMSRHLHLQTEVSHKIWGAGKDFWFVEFDFDKENPESMLNFNIQGSISEYNKAKILANTKRGRITKVRKGLIPGLNRIYGYTFDKEQDILVENEEEKAVYLMMVDLLLNHDYSCPEIAEYLAENDIASPKGDKWYATTITRILKNETYTGIYYYGKTRVVTTNGEKKQVPVPRNEWYSISIPPYISKETHSKILRRIKELRNIGSGRPSTNLLKGIAICGRCGRTVNSGGASKIKDKILKYYACSQNAKKAYKVGTGESNKTCRGKTWRVDLVDEKIWSYIIEILKNPQKFIEAIIKKQNDTNEREELLKNKEKYEQLIQSKKTEHERYTEMYAKGYIKTLQELDAKLAKVDKQIESLEDEISIINNKLKFTNEQHDSLELIKKTLSDYNSIIASSELEVEEKRKLIRTLLKKVVLHDDNTLDLYFTFGENIDDYTKNINNRQGDGRSEEPVRSDLGRLFGRNGLVDADQFRAALPLSDSSRVPRLYGRSAAADCGIHCQGAGLCADASIACPAEERHSGREDNVRQLVQQCALRAECDGEGDAEPSGALASDLSGTVAGQAGADDAAAGRFKMGPQMRYTGVQKRQGGDYDMKETFNACEERSMRHPRSCRTGRSS